LIGFPRLHRKQLPDKDNILNEMTTTAKLSNWFWTSPEAIARGEEPIFEPEHDPTFLQDESPDANKCDHVPFMNLTKEERNKKSDQFKFGLCAHCDAGLDDESDFVCEPRGLGCSWVMACNACHDYYQQLSYTRGVDCGLGCN
jgi:hypothetical protein